MKCKLCGQPMLPKGKIKQPNEYDHAAGCPTLPLVINVRGNSGSGKTFLTRKFMSLAKPLVIKPIPGGTLDDTVWKFERQPWVILGRYTNACGGCDTIKTQAEIVRRVELYAYAGFNIWLEGLIMSTIYGTVGEYSERFGNRWVFAYLDTPIEKCISRIKFRRIEAGNEKPLNETNTRNREATILRNREIVIQHERRVVDLPYRDALAPLLKIIRKEGLK